MSNLRPPLSASSSCWMQSVTGAARWAPSFANLLGDLFAFTFPQHIFIKVIQKDITKLILIYFLLTLCCPKILYITDPTTVSQEETERCERPYSCDKCHCTQGLIHRKALIVTSQKYKCKCLLIILCL